jgi:hypothetical protein
MNITVLLLNIQGRVYTHRAEFASHVDAVEWARSPSHVANDYSAAWPSMVTALMFADAASSKQGTS